MSLNIKDKNVNTMENVKFKFSEKKLLRSEIEEFEREYNIKLPDELKNLLLQYNGGVLEKEMKDYAFAFLRPIKYGINTLEVAIDDLQITEHHIPREEIPFADDQFGNIFAISTRPEDYGKIYIWYMDVGEPRREFVANSLEEFFTGERNE